MMIANEKVVSIHYTLTNDKGETLDSSIGSTPLEYIQGRNNIIPGLENQLVGKKVGDKLKVSVTPKDGYGEMNSDMIQQIPVDHFKDVGEVQLGMHFQVGTPDGGVIVVRATEVTKDHITVDGNHPLAGVNLNFDVEVMSIREATAEELEHGHLHMGAGCCGGNGEGGHCHDNACEDEGDDQGHGGCCGGHC